MRWKSFYSRKISKKIEKQFKSPIKSCALVLSFILTGCLNYNPIPKLPPPTDKPRIAVIGDSHTTSIVIEDSGDRFRPTFPGILKERLEGIAYVENRGCGGSTTIHWAQPVFGIRVGNCRKNTDMMTYQLLPVLPLDIVVVQLGGNDAILGQNTEAVKANFNRIVDRLLSAGVKYVVLLIPPPEPGLEGKLDSVLETLDTIAHEVIPSVCAARPEVYCGRDSYTFLTRDDYGIKDFIHMKYSGHEKVVDNLMPILEQLLMNL